LQKQNKFQCQWCSYLQFGSSFDNYLFGCFLMYLNLNNRVTWKLLSVVLTRFSFWLIFYNLRSWLSFICDSCVHISLCLIWADNTGILKFKSEFNNTRILYGKLLLYLTHLKQFTSFDWVQFSYFQSKYITKNIVSVIFVNIRFWWLLYYNTITSLKLVYINYFVKLTGKNSIQHFQKYLIPLASIYYLLLSESLQ
jgi:hypothetical protein